MINAALACFFFMYAFQNPDEGECYAKEGLKQGHPQVPISVPETSQAEAVYATGYTEVSGQYQSWFIQGFVLSCSVVVYSILSYVYLLLDKEEIAVSTEILGFVTQVLTIMWLLHGAYIRFNHTGRVCSGAFVEGSDALNKGPPY